MKVEFIQPNGLSIVRDCTGYESISTHLTIGECWNNSAQEEIKLVCGPEFWKAVECWEYFRGRYGKAIKLNSNYRTKSFNASVQGEANSLHCIGAAFDNQIGKVSDVNFQKYLGWMENICIMYNVQAELGRYDWGIHTGFVEKLPYLFNGLVYTFDKRS